MLRSVSAFVRGESTMPLDPPRLLLGSRHLEENTPTEEQLRRIDGQEAVERLVHEFGAKSVHSWLRAAAALAGEAL